MSVNGDYIGATHLAQVLSFRSRIDKKVKVAARTAANLSQEPGSMDPIGDPLDMVTGQYQIIIGCLGAVCPY